MEKPRPEKALLGHGHQCKECVHPEIKNNSNSAVTGIISVHRQSKVCKERLFFFLTSFFKKCNLLVKLEVQIRFWILMPRFDEVFTLPESLAKSNDCPVVI